jgi:hypothetical protein
MPSTVTVLPVPTLGSPNVAEVSPMVTWSPDSVPDSVTASFTEPLYTRLVPVAVTVIGSGVMFAVMPAGCSMM